MEEKLKELAKLIQVVDDQLAGSYRDPVENYQKELLVRLRKRHKDLEEKFYQGAITLLTKLRKI